MAVFERACHLHMPAGDVIALVDSDIGDGPLNIVIHRLGQVLRLAQSGAVHRIAPGTAASLDRSWLHIDGLQVSLGGAEIWEPRPDWHRLRAHHATIISRLSELQALALEHAPDDSLLLLTQSSCTADCQTAPHATDYTFTQTLGIAISEATTSLAADWRGDRASLMAGAAHLAGLGSGLTPSGDDFLCGIMLGAWLAHPEPRPLCQSLLDAAAPRTTTLSAAFLRAAADGQCSVAWHRLLAALDAGSEEDLAAATHDVLAYGHTSGADTLAGFLWSRLAAL